MEPDALLPGLERLIQVCREQGFVVRSEPAAEGVAQSHGGGAAGPFDPQLAAFYRRFRRATLADLLVYSLGTGADGLSRVNEMLRRRGQEPFLSCVLFGQVPSLAYYYGVVPALADARGVQPVLYIDNHDEKCVLPVASSVDHLFMTYARFLEALPEQPDFVPGEGSSATFPFSVPGLVAEDRALVEMLRAGRFDGLVSTDAESQEWIQRLLQASPAGGT